MLRWIWSDGLQQLRFHNVPIQQISHQMHRQISQKIWFVHTSISSVIHKLSFVIHKLQSNLAPSDISIWKSKWMLLENRGCTIMGKANEKVERKIYVWKEKLYVHWMFYSPQDLIIIFWHFCRVKRKSFVLIWVFSNCGICWSQPRPEEDKDHFSDIRFHGELNILQIFKYKCKSCNLPFFLKDQWRCI